VIGTLPRPVLMAIVGGVLVIAMFVLTRGNGNQTSSSPPPAATAPPSGNNGGTPATQPKAPAQSGAPSQPSSTPSGSATPSTNSTSKPGAKGGSPSGSPGATSSRARTLPKPVSKAVSQHKVIVLLFWSPRGTDDRDVKHAVDSLSHRGGKVAVFTDRPKNVARYTRISAAINVVQTPTLVVVDRKGNARVATGYLDRETVAQYVIDAFGK
jgi:hypothetical protein